MPSPRVKKDGRSHATHSGVIIRNALMVVTGGSRPRCIPGGCVVVRDRAIVHVGPCLPRSFGDISNCHIIDATGCVVIPGLINTHHHFFQVLTRNLAAVQDEGLFPWLSGLYPVWQHLSAEAIYDAALAAMSELLLTGCTTTADHMYLYPRRLPLNLMQYEIAASRAVGMRFHACHGSMTLGRSQGGLPPDELVRTDDEILAESERLISIFHDPQKFSMCRMALAPCAPFNVSTGLLRRTAALARKHKVFLHTHLAETGDEEQFCLKHFGMRPLAYMEKLDWAGRDVWYAHGIHFTDAEIKRLAKSGTGIAHCPTSNMRLGSGIAPVRAMLDAGVRVGLAVDGSSSNDTSDMLGELRQCLLAARVRSGAASMSAADVFSMATAGGASLLGRDDIGALAPGKAADIAVFDVSGIDYAGSLHDPLAALVFCGASHRAKAVVVNGRVVVNDGVVTTINEHALAEKVNEHAAAVRRAYAGAQRRKR